MLDLEDKTATSVCERFVEDGVVSSACLRKGIHTTSALDNLDHNPTSITFQSSFHGTGISFFQFPTKDNPGEDRPLITLPLSGTSKHNLPESYAIIPAVSLKISDVDVPRLGLNTATTQSCLDQAISKEEAWIDRTLGLLEKELDSGDKIVWAAHYALQHYLQKILQVCVHFFLFFPKSQLFRH